MPNEQEAFLVEKYRSHIVFLYSMQSSVEGQSSRFVENVEKNEPYRAGFVVEGGFVVTSTLAVDSFHFEKKDTVCAGIYVGSEGEKEIYESRELQFIDRDDERGIAVFSFVRDFGVEGFSIEDLLADEDGLKKGVDALLIGFPFNQQSDSMRHVKLPARIEMVIDDEERNRPAVITLTHEATPLCPGSIVLSYRTEDMHPQLAGFVISAEEYASTARSTSDVYDMLIDIVYTLRGDESVVNDGDDEYSPGNFRDEFGYDNMEDDE